MSHQPPTTRTRTALVAFAVGSLLAAFGTGVPAAEADPGGPSRLDGPVAFKDGRYVVVLREPAATRYAGGRAGLPATRSTEGRFAGRTEAVRRYSQHLRRTQEGLAREVGADVARSYTVALNGFAARLTGDQAARLAGDRRVLLLRPDERRRVHTDRSPAYLGLSGRNGAWTRTGGPARAGAGVVVGVLDSGIWPESASFAGARLTAKPKTRWDIRRSGSTTSMDKADGTRFQGQCQTGDGWTPADCSTKLIGARYYPDVFALVPEADRSPKEYLSPRDGNGHGTHTAGTAAGNHGVRAKVDGVPFGRISGMAPAARIAAYKVCFDDTDEATGDCFTSASLAAIDDAVADGVDVINYSISGGADVLLDPVELAFEGAAEAGVFVATSAGNEGTVGSVNHASPWLASVAASTHKRLENTIVLGNGKRVLGVSVNRAPLGRHRLVQGVQAPASGVPVEDAQLCLADSLNPAKVRGKIVVCIRGVSARVDKSAEVERAGGVGMILVNPERGSLDADFHAVPTVHVSHTAARRLFAHLLQAGPRASARFVVGNLTRTKTPVPQLAEFSSRGPAAANDSDILKPDLSAPGVSVLAAVSPPSNRGRRFDLYSGTSMASPHVAGLGAFLLGLHPRWTPMQVKSAMMTSARRLVNAQGRLVEDALGQGSGQVRARKMLDPGLFVTSTPRQWLGYLTGQGLDTGVPAVAAKDLNQPSMAQGQVVSKVYFRRSFTATRAGTWTVSAKVPGFSVKLGRAKVRTSRAGDIEDLGVTFTRTTAPLGEFATGHVTLTGPTTVRIPVALRPVSVRAPREVAGTGVASSATVPVTAGFTGDLAVNVSGLAEADTAVDTVAEGARHYYCVETSDTTRALRVDVDAVDDTADLDLYGYVMSGDCNSAAIDYLALSATPAADESFTVEAPEAGSYVIEVDGYAGPAGGGDIDYRLDVFDVDAAATAGGLAAVPNPVPVTAGRATSFDATWSGLTADRRYLGMFEYDGALAPTYLLVDTEGP